MGKACFHIAKAYNGVCTIGDYPVPGVRPAGPRPVIEIHMSSETTIVGPASAPSSYAPAASPTPVSPDRIPAMVVAIVGALVCISLAADVSVRQAVLFLIGMALGVALLHASFGFAGGWRNMLLESRSRAIRAQMIMVGLAAVGFFPILAMSPLGERVLVGAIAPAGVAVAAGAAMFGIGMQLAGGCGSGTLFGLGGGSKRMLATLVFFVLGAFIGTAHLGWWLSLPSLPPVALGNSLGVYPGLALTLAGLALVYYGVRAVEQRVRGGVEPLGASPRSPGGASIWTRLAVGPWTLLAAAVALAALNIATLVIAGHPWSITYAFGLWGAKIAQAVGAPVAEWPFWQAPFNTRALNGSVLEDVTSVMNFGLLLGSALAASLAGRFALARTIGLRSYATAIIGGLLMGYGARISFGCNVGALFSGIASGSLHGWLWFACAFAGSWLYVRVAHPQPKLP